MPKNLCWLASYPKSGNTWLRLFLANYIFNPDAPLPINMVNRLGSGDANKAAYRKFARVLPEALTEKRALALRTGVLEAITRNGSDIMFMKTHNQNKAIGQTGLIPPQLTRSAIYIARNPLDMLLSFAAHYNLSPADAVKATAFRDNKAVATDKNVTQYIGSWSDHVRSWTRPRAYPVLTIRYEDLIADAQTQFCKVLEFIGVPPDQERAARAVRFCSIEELQKQEATTPFTEKSRHADRFFRSGKSGQWREALSEELVEEVYAIHGAEMTRLGYL